MGNISHPMGPNLGLFLSQADPMPTRRGLGME